MAIYSEGSTSSDRVGVVGAGPGRRTAGYLVRVDNADNRSISPGNHQEHAGDDNKHAEADHGHPLPILLLLPLAPVIVEPHATVGLETHQRSQQSTDERYEAAEDGNAAGDKIGNKSYADSATQPGPPVDKGVCGKMMRTSEDADKDVLGGDLEIRVSTVRRIRIKFR